ncbi:pentapeptide repeat-containing protein [Undibacterium pigrum]|uniref:Pentapeptide repeat protein n=1 Tax=Undibacterium pigrum TaxID=401470 RepID=A0A318JCV0_9BURK|nr:pentapeptide repeat-containing protein [Undibacterium pigrum]PXX41638.1 pentapeptide repeat protein [Undibacterium pigrum]
MARIISRLVEPDELQLKLLDIVKQHGIECWEIVYYSDWEIYDVHFDDITNDEVSFYRCTLEQCSFADFSPAYHNFNNSTLVDVTFSKAGLKESLFSEVNFKNVTFDNANLLKVIFMDAIFENVSFANAELFKVNFYGCDLRHINFDNVEMRYTRFANCLLSDSLMNHPNGAWDDSSAEKKLFIVH